MREVVLRINFILKKMLVLLHKNKEGFNLQNTRRNIEIKYKTSNILKSKLQNVLTQRSLLLYLRSWA